MSNLVANELSELQGLAIFQKMVKGKIGVYNTREQYDSISYFDEGDKDTYAISDAFEVHEIKASVLDKQTESTLVIQNETDIINSNGTSGTLDTYVSKFTKSQENIISRLAEDTSYKKDHEDILTKAQTRYATIYKKSYDNQPVGIVIDNYKSDADEPEKLVKKRSTIINIDGISKDEKFYTGTEIVIMDSTNMISDYYKCKCKYIYSIDGELLKVHLLPVVTSPETEGYITPRCVYNEANNKFTVTYEKNVNGDRQVYQIEDFDIVGDKARLTTVTTKDGMKTEFIHKGKGIYNYKTTTNWSDGFKNKEFTILGTTDRPISAEYFMTNTDKYGIPTMMTNPYMNSTFIAEPTGHYYRVHSTINEVLVDNKVIYEYDHDQYGVICSQKLHRDGDVEEMCKYDSNKVIDDDGNYHGTIIESFIHSNPFSRGTTKEYFYRAVKVEGGRITKDYRAIMVKDE